MATAATATPWPMTRAWSASSIAASLDTSLSTSLATGMPVQPLTTLAICSSSISSDRAGSSAGAGTTCSPGASSASACCASLLVGIDADTRVELDAAQARRLVEQVDRLVGEEPSGDVALGERRRRHNGIVGDPHIVMQLVPLLEAPQDRDGLGGRRLADEDRLEPRSRAGSLSMCSRYSSSVVAPIMRSSPRARNGLIEIAGVDGALRSAGAHQRVQLVQEGDDLPVGLGHGRGDLLEPLLELAPKSGAADERTEIEREHVHAVESRRHVAGSDALRQPFDDRRLPDAGFTDQYRVVLGAAAQHLDHAEHLGVAADHRVELTLLGPGGQITAELVERRVRRAAPTAT